MSGKNKISRPKRDVIEVDASEWLNNITLRLCSPSTRSLWVDVLCLMQLSDRKGYLEIKQKKLNKNEICTLLGYDRELFEHCFNELLYNDFLKLDDSNSYFSAEIVKKEQIKQKRSESGKKGGNPHLNFCLSNLVKQNHQLTEDEQDIKTHQPEICLSNLVNHLVKQNSESVDNQEDIKRVGEDLLKQSDFEQKNDHIYIYNNIDNIKSIDIGYNNQIPLFEDKERKYEKKERKSEITITHPLQVYIRDNFHQVSKLKKQITQEECEKLLAKFTNEQIANTLTQMENFKQLPSKYISVYLTLNNWLSRNNNESTARNNPNNRGANYEDALRNF